MRREFLFPFGSGTSLCIFYTKLRPYGNWMKIRVSIPIDLEKKSYDFFHEMSEEFSSENN